MHVNDIHPTIGKAQMPEATLASAILAGDHGDALISIRHLTEGAVVGGGQLPHEVDGVPVAAGSYPDGVDLDIEPRVGGRPMAPRLSK